MSTSAQQTRVHPIPAAIYLGVASLSILFAVIGAFDRDRTWLYLGTAALTLLLTWAAFLAVPMLERSDRRPAGSIALLAMATIWAVLVTLIWNAHFAWFGEETGARLGASLIILTVSILPIVGALSQIRRPRWRRAAWVQLLGFGVIGTIATAVPWMAWDANTTAGCLLPAIVGTILVATLQPTTLVPTWIRQVIAIGAALLSLLFARLIITPTNPGSLLWWNPDPPTVERLLLVLILGYAGVLAVAALNLLLVPRLARAGWLRWACLGCILATITLFTGAMLEVGMLMWSGNPANMSTTAKLLLRLGLASGIVSAVFLLLFTFVVRGSMTEGSLSRRVSIALTCPRCRENIELDEGEQVCPRCSLGFRIAFDRPTCRRCGHTVDPSASDQCSECGTPILLDAPKTASTASI